MIEEYGRAKYCLKPSMNKSRTNDKKNPNERKNQTIFGAKLNLLVCDQNAELTTALVRALKSKRVKASVYFSPLTKTNSLPVVLIKTSKGEERITFQSGMNCGGVKMRISEFNETAVTELKKLADSVNRSDFVSKIEERGDELILTTAYFNEDRFERYLMAQAQILVKARVETLSAYPPFAVDANALTVLHRSLTEQEIRTSEGITFDERFSEGDESEDRILYIELTAEENAQELATAFVTALKKLTEAI